jgi:predicted Zn-dependent protease
MSFTVAGCSIKSPFLGRSRVSLPAIGAVTRTLTEDAARRAAPHLPGIQELKTAIAARRGMSEDNLQRYDELMDASDAVVDLVRSAKLDAAEVAARDLLARFPDQPDGWDRLGMVYEARGENRKAAESYRKVIAFIRLAEQVASASKQPFLDVP